jgi:hypothetical protein
MQYGRTNKFCLEVFELFFTFWTAPSLHNGLALRSAVGTRTQRHLFLYQRPSRVQHNSSFPTEWKLETKWTSRIWSEESTAHSSTRTFITNENLWERVSMTGEKTPRHKLYRWFKRSPFLGAINLVPHLTAHWYTKCYNTSFYLLSTAHRPNKWSLSDWTGYAWHKTESPKLVTVHSALVVTLYFHFLI